MSAICETVTGTSPSDNWVDLCGKPAVALWNGQNICSHCLSQNTTYLKQQIRKKEQEVERLTLEIANEKAHLKSLTKGQK